MGACEGGHDNDCENDKRDHAPLSASDELLCIWRLVRLCDVGLAFPAARSNF